MIEAALSLEADRKLSGEVEADEIYVRSGHSSGHKGKKPPSDPGPPSERHSRRRGLRHGPGRGRADKDRPVIFIQLQRGGAVNLEAAAGVDRETVKRVFRERVEAGSQLYTDSARCYLVLEEEGYALEQVNHSLREFARG
jgi:transposase-like protein